MWESIQWYDGGLHERKWRFFQKKEVLHTRSSPLTWFFNILGSLSLRHGCHFVRDVWNFVHRLIHERLKLWIDRLGCSINCVHRYSPICPLYLSKTLYAFHLPWTIGTSVGRENDHSDLPTRECRRENLFFLSPLAAHRYSIFFFLEKNVVVS